MSDRDSVSSSPALDPSALAAHPVVAVPPDFAEQMVARATNAPASGSMNSPRRWWRVVALAVASAAVLAIVSMLLIGRERGSARGDMTATTRSSVTLPHGSVAVMEPAAHISWLADGDDMAIQQTSGDVFYRVEPGGTFSVDTPAGRVRVLGTCFRVEIDPVPKPRRTASVVVTVYEGRVVLADETQGIEAEAGPGEVIRRGGTRTARDRAAAFQPPALPATSDDERALTVARRTIADQATRIEMLEARLSPSDAANPRPPVETPRQRARRCLDHGGVGCSFVEPTPEALLELAECGLVRVDHPAVVQEAEHASPSAALVDAADLSPQEVQALTSINNAFRGEVHQALREIYLDLGGSTEMAESLPYEALRGAVESMLPSEATAHVVRTVSHERAGLVEPPPSVDDPAERYMRGVLDLGETYERYVAQRLGPDRARDIRLALDGWTGGKSTYGKCDR